jgi:hypothetical protein
MGLLKSLNKDELFTNPIGEYNYKITEECLNKAVTKPIKKNL